MPHKLAHVIQYLSAASVAQTAGFISKEDTGLIVIPLCIPGKVYRFLIDGLIVLILTLYLCAD